MVSDVIIDKLVFSYVAEKPEKDRVFMSNVKYKLKATGFSCENGETVTFRGRNSTIRFVLPTCVTGSTCKENTPLEEYPALFFGAKMMSYRRRCDVITSHQC